jgi:hypothetical protein
MVCGLAGGLLVLVATVSGLLEAADVALNSGSAATIGRGKAQDGCLIAGTLWTQSLRHVALPSPSDGCSLMSDYGRYGYFRARQAATNLCNAK